MEKGCTHAFLSVAIPKYAGVRAASMQPRGTSNLLASCTCNTKPYSDADFLLKPHHFAMPLNSLAQTLYSKIGSG
jgi:hypothetical protein